MAVLSVKHGWAPYLAIAAGVLAGHGDRPVPGHGLHALRGPVVRRHPGRPAGLAGRPARGARRDRHGEHHRPEDHRARPARSTATRWAGSSRSSRSRVSRRSRCAARQQRVRRRACRRRRSALVVLRIGLVAVAVLVAIWVLNDDRGVPLAVLILVGFVPVLLLHHHADDVRPPHLRGGRQRRGGAARGHQRHARARDRVHDRVDDGGGRRRSWPPRGCWR